MQQAEQCGGSCDEEEGEEAEAPALSGALGGPCLLGECLLAQLHVPDHAFSAHGVLSRGAQVQLGDGRALGQCVLEGENRSAACLGVCRLRGYFQGDLELLLSLLAGALVSSLRELLLAGCANSCIYIPVGREEGGERLSFNNRKTSLVEKPMSSSGGSGSGPYTFCLGFFSIAGAGVWKVGDTQASRILPIHPTRIPREACWASHCGVCRTLEAGPQFPSAGNWTLSSHSLHFLVGSGVWPVFL